MTLNPQPDRTVSMMHMLCDSCGMSATIVVTPIGTGAWMDHMESHGEDATYKSWAWEVIPIDYEQPNYTSG